MKDDLIKVRCKNHSSTNGDSRCINMGWDCKHKLKPHSESCNAGITRVDWSSYLINKEHLEVIE